MSWKQLSQFCGAVLIGLTLSGCGSSVITGADEEKEPQFLIGRSRVNAMDYQGAIEAFEQALEANPRSGAAHFELGWLYAEKEFDQATAIYHYERFLKLRPGADNAETIRQHIFRAKQELAKGVLPIPPSTEIQRQMEQLAEENRQLRDQLARLQLAASQVSSNYRAAAPSIIGSSDSRSGSMRPLPGTTAAPRVDRAAVSARTHKVQAGETPLAIARRYHLKVDVLLTANPGLNPKRMRVGQSLVIPIR